MEMAGAPCSNQPPNHCIIYKCTTNQLTHACLQTPDMERGLISSPISHPMSGPSSENSLASTSTCARNLDLAMTPPPPQPFTSYEGGTVYFTAPSVPATPDTNAALLSSPIKRTLPNACQSGISHSPAHQIESIGGTTYFYNNSPYHSPNISHYPSGVCSTTGGAWPHQETPSDLFMSENVRLELLHRNACLLARLDSNDTHGHPLSLGKYHDLYPLDGTSSDHMNDRLPLGYRSTCYKAIRESDGTPCCLRVLKGVKTSYDAIQMAIQSWKRIQHANVASLYDAFISNDFDEPALVCVSSYHPGAETLSSRYIKHHTANENGTAAANPIIFPEDLLWTFAVQLSSAVRSIQAAGLACGTLDPSKIIVTANNRIRLSAVGVLDILNFGSDCPHSITYYQAEDLTLMGHLLLSLACGKWPDDSMEQCTKHMETVEARYSSDFKNLLGYLLSPSEPHQPKTINDLMPMIGPRFYKEMEGAYSKMDRLYDDLSKEETNGKLLRLLCKMGFVVDRPEFDIDPTWSETGDRYLVKLLRDYTFHQ
eukprot:Ihof_evm1s306 gene=Ihof_evmTU1s306